MRQTRARVHARVLAASTTEGVGRQSIPPRRLRLRHTPTHARPRARRAPSSRAAFAAYLSSSYTAKILLSDDQGMYNALAVKTPGSKELGVIHQNSKILRIMNLYLFGKECLTHRSENARKP